MCVKSWNNAKPDILTHIMMFQKYDINFMRKPPLNIWLEWVNNW